MQKKKNAGSRSEEAANLAIQICRDHPSREYESALREAPVRLHRGELSPVRYQKVAGRRLQQQQSRRPGGYSQSTVAELLSCRFPAALPTKRPLAKQNVSSPALPVAE